MGSFQSFKGLGRKKSLEYSTGRLRCVTVKSNEMNLPTKEEIQKAVKQYSSDFGTIAGNDFRNGLEWLIEEVKQLNKK